MWQIKVDSPQLFANDQQILFQTNHHLVQWVFQPDIALSWQYHSHLLLSIYESFQSENESKLNFNWQALFETLTLCSGSLHCFCNSFSFSAIILACFPNADFVSSILWLWNKSDEFVDAKTKIGLLQLNFGSMKMINNRKRFLLPRFLCWFDIWHSSNWSRHSLDNTNTSRKNFFDRLAFSLVFRGHFEMCFYKFFNLCSSLFRCYAELCLNFIKKIKPAVNKFSEWAFFCWGNFWFDVLLHASLSRHTLNMWHWMKWSTFWISNTF